MDERNKKFILQGLYPRNRVRKLNLEPYIGENIDVEVYHIPRRRLLVNPDSIGYRIYLDEKIIFQGVDMGLPWGEEPESNDTLLAVLSFHSQVLEDSDLTEEQEEFIALYGQEIQMFIHGVREGHITLDI